jgi:excinuclease ABC subunit A
MVLRMAKDDAQTTADSPVLSKNIRIRGASGHNLKNISLDIPRDQLTVVTGLSGSGKSTLAFDTVYAEGQRKYMESLSAYARQFLNQLQKPEVESIDGLPPTIAIEQRGSSHNPRSTVATTTEIYDYLRVLFARAGTPHCWECGRKIESQSATQIVDDILKLPAKTKLMVLAPLVSQQKGEHKETFGAIIKQGFVRARVDGEVVEVKDDSIPKLAKTYKHDVAAVVDRIVVKDEVRGRLADSVETALKLTRGNVIIAVEKDGEWVDQLYSESFACPDHPHVSLPEMEPRLFSFNSPQGACGACHGLGTTFEFDPDLVIPDPDLSLENGAVEAWRKNGKRMNIYYSRVLRTFCRDFGVDYYSPAKEMTKKQRDVLLYGTGNASGKKGYFEGVIPNLQRRFENTDSDYVKQRMSGYMSEQPCPVCCGKRLKNEALCVRLYAEDLPEPCETDCSDDRAANYVATRDDDGGLKPKAKKVKEKRDAVKTDTLPGHSIHDVTCMNVEEAAAFFASLNLDAEGQKIAAPIAREVGSRLGFLVDVGLGYLNLNRKTGSLSGGEAQRIRLATQVGSKLVGVCYVLDEPTIGLHQRDNDRLIRTLLKLRDLGNTVLMVEHDEDCIRAADHLIDIGPAAGAHGGQVIAEGPMPDVLAQRHSLTVQYLTHEKTIDVPERRRPVSDKKCLEIKGCSSNNLKDVSVKFPLGGLTCVTGVSGSGKSTLVNQTLLPALKRKIYQSRVKPGKHKSLAGTGQIDKVIEIDQSPIGRTPRSNPATYTGVFDEVRKIFSQTREAKLRGYAPGRFSFNVKGGRCASCDGQGQKLIEMHFLPDVYVECEQCHGTRYNPETLQIKYRGKSIADVLALTIEEAKEFFENFPPMYRMLKALFDVGLGYIKLGQPSTQLSGGEAQRVKLASELGKNPTGHTIYVLDEPTTGLHFEDIRKLLAVLDRLADLGNTVLVIEHNLDVIKCADWLIDMGPEGGDAGGTVLTEGTPEQVAQHPTSHTARYLATALEARRPQAAA